MPEPENKEGSRELKVPDRFGVFLRWPQDGDDWIHPDDVEKVLGMIPSRRIFQRIREDDNFSKLVYGKFSIRIRQALWLEVQTDGYLIGDRVEVRSQMGKRRPVIATIQEMFWDLRRRAVEYRLLTKEQPQHEPFYFTDIQPAFRLDKPLSGRQADLLARSRIQ